MLHTIRTGAYEPLPQGIYPVSFVGYKEKETSKGLSYLWEFKTDDGKSVSGFAGEPGQTPTVKNKFGKWLCSIACRPLSEGSVDPDQYVGKRYQAVINADGKLEMFTPMA